jgi:hypothetical protein
VIGTMDMDQNRLGSKSGLSKNIYIYIYIFKIVTDFYSNLTEMLRCLIVNSK